MPVTLLTDTTARQLLRDVQRLKQQIALRDAQRSSPVFIEPEGPTFYNSGAMTVPAYGLARIDDSFTFQNVPIAACKAGDDTWSDSWLVNGPRAVEAGDIGTAQAGPVVIFAYDTPTPAAKDIYGPKPDQATASLGYPALLRVIDVLDADLNLARGLLLDSPITLLGKTTAAVSAGAMATDGSDWIIWHGTIGSGGDAGFTTLPAAEAAIDIADETFFLLHRVNGAWVAGESAAASGGVRIVQATLDGDMAPADADADVDGVVSLSSDDAPTISSAENRHHLGGLDGDLVTLVEDTSGESVWFILQVTHHDCSGE